MKRIDTLVIGGGQAGLAMSRCLSDRAVDHIVAGATFCGGSTRSVSLMRLLRMFNIKTSRRQPSLQLVGRSDLRSLDVSTLQRRGVRVFGRLLGAEYERAWFDDDLVATTSASDVKLAEMLQRIDAFISSAAVGTVEPKEPFEPTWPSALGIGKSTIDMQADGIDTVVWATGFIRRYPWLRVPVFDERGEIRHRGGITPVPGLFVLGMHFQRRRKSAFIDGVGDDAAFLLDQIVSRASFEAAAAS